MSEQHVRDARPGEMCPCGAPAKAALIAQFGDVPTCRPPDELRRQVEQAVSWASGRINSPTT